MNARVAKCARLVLNGLVVGRSNRLSRREVGRRRMALEADRIHVCAIEQPRIWSAVRCMAGRAALGLHYHVLVYEWPCSLAMTFCADHIHLRRRAKVFAIEGAMRIVTVGALQETFFNLVMEGHVELCLGFGVALVAQLRLRSFEQLLLDRAVVDAVTTYAAHLVFAVCRALEVGVLALVAAEAPCIHFLRRGLCRIENLGYVPAAIDVRLARTVATFAGNARLAVHLGNLRVRIRSKSLCGIFMACGADFLADILSRDGCRLTGFGSARA